MFSFNDSVLVVGASRSLEVKREQDARTTLSHHFSDTTKTVGWVER